MYLLLVNIFVSRHDLGMTSAYDFQTTFHHFFDVKDSGSVAKNDVYLSLIHI